MLLQGYPRITKTILVQLVGCFKTHFDWIDTSLPSSFHPTFVRALVRSLIHSASLRSLTRKSNHSWMHSFIIGYWQICLFARSRFRVIIRFFVCSCVRSLVCSFARSLARSLVGTFFRLLVRSFIFSFVCLMVGMVVRSLICPFARLFSVQGVCTVRKGSSCRVVLGSWYIIFSRSVARCLSQTLYRLRRNWSCKIINARVALGSFSQCFSSSFLAFSTCKENEHVYSGFQQAKS